jgi:hypothetical protein
LSYSLDVIRIIRRIKVEVGRARTGKHIGFCGKTRGNKTTDGGTIILNLVIGK